MSRSVWKIPYIHNVFFTNMLKNKKIFNVWHRSSTIPAFFINKKFKVHNGIWLLTLNVKSLMVGSKFGEFSFSKRMGKEIHFKQKNKKKNKKV